LGQSIGKTGVVKLRLRGGSQGQWDNAERSVLTGLANFDLIDVYRQMVRTPDLRFRKTPNLFDPF